MCWNRAGEDEGTARLGVLMKRKKSKVLEFLIP